MTEIQTEPTDQNSLRSRTFTWSNPRIFATAAGKNGMELFQAIETGELPPPPILEMLGVERLVAEHGSVRVYLRPQEFHYNPLGGVHGGVIATLLDTAAACSVHSTLPAGVGYTSLDLTTKFLRPVTIEAGLLCCTGKVISKGRRTALASAELTDGDGRLYAHAVSSCMILGGE